LVFVEDNETIWESEVVGFFGEEGVEEELLRERREGGE